MQGLTHFFQNLDFISNEVKLTFHKKNEVRLKTALGGLLSLTSIALLIGICLYFLINLIEQGTVFITYSTESTPFVNLSDSYSYPILLRLSDRNSMPFNSPESIYQITLKFWYGGSNTVDEKLMQKSVDIEVEPCSLDKHFGAFRYLFENMTDLNTFFCPRLRYPNETIYGRYGDVYRFGYYHFSIRMCLNKPECLPSEEVIRLTEGVYLDFRTIDNTVDNYHKQSRAENIKSDRFSLSSTVYKRLWLYFDHVKYITDNGILFPTEKINYFSKYESIRYDTDQRDLSGGVNAGIFTGITFLNSGNTLIYNRRYLKLQDYFASIGGIAKFIEICAIILNYCYSSNTYYWKMINNLSLADVLDINRKRGELRISKSTRFQTNNYIERTKFDLNESKWKLKSQNKSNSHILMKMNSHWYRMIPLFLNKKQNSQVFNQLIQRVKEMLNITTILLKIENNEKALNSIFDGEKSFDLSLNRNRLKRIDHKFKFSTLKELN